MVNIFKKEEAEEQEASEVQLNAIQEQQTIVSGKEEEPKPLPTEKPLYTGVLERDLVLQEQLEEPEWAKPRGEEEPALEKHDIEPEAMEQITEAMGFDKPAADRDLFNLVSQVQAGDSPYATPQADNKEFVKGDDYLYDVLSTEYDASYNLSGRYISKPLFVAKGMIHKFGDLFRSVGGINEIGSDLIMIAAGEDRSEFVEEVLVKPGRMASKYVWHGAGNLLDDLIGWDEGSERRLGGAGVLEQGVVGTGQYAGPMIIAKKLTGIPGVVAMGTYSGGQLHHEATEDQDNYVVPAGTILNGEPIKESINLSNVLSEEELGKARLEYVAQGWIPETIGNLMVAGSAGVRQLALAKLPKAWRIVVNQVVASAEAGGYEGVTEALQNIKLQQIHIKYLKAHGYDVELDMGQAIEEGKVAAVSTILMRGASTGTSMRQEANRIESKTQEKQQVANYLRVGYINPTTGRSLFNKEEAEFIADKSVDSILPAKKLDKMIKAKQAAVNKDAEYQGLAKDDIDTSFAETVLEGGTQSTVGEVARKLVETGEARHGEILSHLLEEFGDVLDNTDLVVELQPAKENSAGTRADGTVAFYHNEINKSDVGYLLVHEIGHLLTKDRIRKSGILTFDEFAGDESGKTYHEVMRTRLDENTEISATTRVAVEELLGAYEDAWNATKEEARGEYGFKDLFEFSSEALSNGEFQAFLNTVESANNIPLVQRIIAAIKTILGVERNTALERAINSTFMLAEDKSPSLLPDGVDNLISEALDVQNPIDEVNTLATKRGITRAVRDGDAAGAIQIMESKLPDGEAKDKAISKLKDMVPNPLEQNKELNTPTLYAPVPAVKNLVQLNQKLRTNLIKATEFREEGGALAYNPRLNDGVRELLRRDDLTWAMVDEFVEQADTESRHHKIALKKALMDIFASYDEEAGKFGDISDMSISERLAKEEEIKSVEHFAPKIAPVVRSAYGYTTTERWEGFQAHEFVTAETIHLLGHVTPERKAWIDSNIYDAANTVRGILKTADISGLEKDMIADGLRDLIYTLDYNNTALSEDNMVMLNEFTVDGKKVALPVKEAVIAALQAPDGEFMHHLNNQRMARGRKAIFNPEQMYNKLADLSRGVISSIRNSDLNNLSKGILSDGITKAIGELYKSDFRRSVRDIASDKEVEGIGLSTATIMEHILHSDTIGEAILKVNQDRSKSGSDLIIGRASLKGSPLGNKIKNSLLKKNQFKGMERDINSALDFITAIDIGETTPKEDGYISRFVGRLARKMNTSTVDPASIEGQADDLLKMKTKFFSRMASSRYGIADVAAAIRSPSLYQNHYQMLRQTNRGRSNLRSQMESLFVTASNATGTKISPNFMQTISSSAETSGLFADYLAYPRVYPTGLKGLSKEARKSLREEVKKFKVAEKQLKEIGDSGELGYSWKQMEAVLDSTHNYLQGPVLSNYKALKVHGFGLVWDKYTTRITKKGDSVQTNFGKEFVRLSKKVKKNEAEEQQLRDMTAELEEILPSYWKDGELQSESAENMAKYLGALKTVGSRDFISMFGEDITGWGRSNYWMNQTEFAGYNPDLFFGPTVLAKKGVPLTGAIKARTDPTQPFKKRTFFEALYTHALTLEVQARTFENAKSMMEEVHRGQNQKLLDENTAEHVKKHVGKTWGSPMYRDDVSTKEMARFISIANQTFWTAHFLDPVKFAFYTARNFFQAGPLGPLNMQFSPGAFIDGYAKSLFHLAKRNPRLSQARKDMFRREVDERGAMAYDHISLRDPFDPAFKASKKAGKFKKGRYIKARINAMRQKVVGNMAAFSDTTVNRNQVFNTAYLVADTAVNKYLEGKVGLDGLGSKLGFELMEPVETTMLMNMLLDGVRHAKDNGLVNPDAVRDSKEVEEFVRQVAVMKNLNVNFGYRVQEKSMMEANPVWRGVVGILTYPRGRLENFDRNAIRPMLRGAKDRDLEELSRGFVSLISGLVASTIYPALWVMAFGARKNRKGSPVSPYTASSAIPGAVTTITSGNPALSTLSTLTMSTAEALGEIISGDEDFGKRSKKAFRTWLKKNEGITPLLGSISTWRQAYKNEHVSEDTLYLMEWWFGADMDVEREKIKRSASEKWVKAILKTDPVDLDGVPFSKQLLYGLTSYPEKSWKGVGKGGRGRRVRRRTLR